MTHSISELQTTTITNEQLKSWPFWHDLLFGTYNLNEVIKCVGDPFWLRTRQSMLGASLQLRRAILIDYIVKTQTSQGGIAFATKVQVTNYVHALRRGGIIK